MTGSGVPFAGRMPAPVLGVQQDDAIIGKRLRRHSPGGVQTRIDAWKVRARRRRALARELRRTASCSAPPSRLDRLTVPVLPDRVGRMRAEMISLASALERAEQASPVTVAIVDRLLRDGASPLYDERVPESQLASALHAARAGLVVSPATHVPPEASDYQSGLI